MRKNLKIPRILKIIQIDGFKITCMFNNGESRLLDFEQIFREWNVSEGDFEYPLLQINEFQKVDLRNSTLSWDNIEIELVSESGIVQKHPYIIDPLILFQQSRKIEIGD